MPISNPSIRRERFVEDYEKEVAMGLNFCVVGGKVEF